MTRRVSFALPCGIALAAVLSMAGAPALGQVCMPVPADTSPPANTGLMVIQPPTYDDAKDGCCDPYEDSSASSSCRNENIEMVQFGTQCSIRAECHVPQDRYPYILGGYYKSTSITVSTGDVEDLNNCIGDLTNGNC